MADVSLNFRQAAYAAETGRVLILLFTLEHASLAEPILISSDPTVELTELSTPTEKVYGTISNGNTFIFYPMNIKLPDDADEGMGEMTLEIDNVHRSLVQTIRSISTPVTVKTEIILDNDLDTVEVSWPEFILSNISYNATTISGTLRPELLEKEPFPAGSFTPSYFRGMF